MRVVWKWLVYMKKEQKKESIWKDIVSNTLLHECRLLNNFAKYSAQEHGPIFNAKLIGCFMFENDTIIIQKKWCSIISFTTHSILCCMTPELKFQSFCSNYSEYITLNWIQTMVTTQVNKEDEFLFENMLESIFEPKMTRPLISKKVVHICLNDKAWIILIQIYVIICWI